MQDAFDFQDTDLQEDDKAGDLDAAGRRRGAAPDEGRVKEQHVSHGRPVRIIDGRHPRRTQNGNGLEQAVADRLKKAVICMVHQQVEDDQPGQEGKNPKEPFPFAVLPEDIVPSLEKPVQ